MTENEASAANTAQRDVSASATSAKTPEAAQEPQEHGDGATTCVQPRGVTAKEPQTLEPLADTDAKAPDARTRDHCKMTFTTAEQLQTHACGATTDTLQGPDPQETAQSGDENAQTLQTRACTKCSKKFTTAELLQAHLCGAPEKAEHPHDEKADVKARALKARTCAKCGKTFSAPQGLRTHLSNVYPCDQPRPPLQMRTPKPVSKTCPKCGKSFTQWQGLRTHLNRVFPCDQEKPPSASSIAEKKPKTKAYTKCGKVFTAQSYKTHAKRSGPCNEERQVGEEDVKDLELKEKVRLFARRAYLKRIGRLHERDEPAPHREDANDNAASMPPASSMDGNRKRSAENAGEPLEPSGTESKRPRGDSDTQVNARDDVDATVNLATLNQESDQLDSSKLSPVYFSEGTSTTNDGGDGENVGVPTVYPHSAYSSTGEHGGNLLDGGCCCAPCVRSWAMKLLVRMQLLEKEITRLRQQVAASDDSEHATDANPITNSSTIQPQVAPPAAAQQGESDVRAGVLSPQMQPPCSAFPPAEKAPMISDSMVASGGGAAAAVIVNNTVEKGGGRQEDAQRLELAQNLSPSQSPQPEETRAYEAESVVAAASGEAEKVVAELLHPIVAEVVSGVVQLANVNQSTAGLFVSPNHDEERAIPLHLSDAATKKLLVGEYARVNDEIILNERAVEDSLQHVDTMMNFDKATAMELRSQIEELRVSINNEKHKRDSAAAALIAHDWATRSTALQIAMKRMAEVDASSAILHKRCADIASQLEGTKEVLAALGDRIEFLNESGNDNRGRYAELGALSSKFAAEQYAKGRLESECEGAYMELLKSSRQIRVMTRRRLLEAGAQG